MFEKLIKGSKLNKKKGYTSAPSHFPVLSSKQLLTSKRCEYVLKRFPAIINAPKEHYEELYLDAIHHFADFVQGLPAVRIAPYNYHGGMLDLGLERAYVTLLNYRKEFPIKGIKPEDMPPSLARWTYALFTAGMLYGIGQIAATYWVTVCDEHGKDGTRWQPIVCPMGRLNTHYRYGFETINRDPIASRATLMISKMILPDAGLAWIAEDKDILNYWLAILENDESGSGVFAKIVLPAEWQLLEHPPEALGLLGDTAGREITRKPQTEAEKKHKGFLGDHEALLAAEAQEHLAAEEAKAGHGELPPGAALREVRSEDITGAGLEIGEVFLQWLRNGIIGQSISVNRASSKIHVTSAGVMMLYPELFQEFIKQNPQYNTSPQAINKSLDSLGHTAKTQSNVQQYLKGQHQSSASLIAKGSQQQQHQKQAVVLKDPTVIFYSTKIPYMNEAFKVTSLAMQHTYPNLTAWKSVPATYQPPGPPKPSKS
ncbi:MAG: hypothetical protein CMF50_02300 [Legionellales bacterium]|nr:hypothetical protein [Legionellales bacterium]|tara:strand:+ start:16265 stop:17719 length:1455 start_codon:yes stop_codon:yes gene_type:complete